MSEDGGTVSAGQLMKRYLYLWLFTEGPLIIADWLMGERFSFIIDVLIIVLVVLSRVYFILYFINVVLRKGKPMPHDKLSRTVYMATEIGRGESTVDVSI